MATNSFGLDAAYFSDKLSLVLRDLGHFTPEELARTLARMARTACEDVLGEAEFTVQAAPTCAAAAVPGIPAQWEQSLSHCWPEDADDRDGDWLIGAIDEDGNRYEVVRVEASQYDAEGESQKIAEAIVNLWAYAAAPAVPELEGDDLTVWRITLPSGEQCHFGTESMARAWGRGEGKVERVDLKVRPRLEVAHTPSVAALAQQPALVAQEPVAWQDPENLDRICSARSMLEAKRTGGATLSALKPLTRPLYAAPHAAEQPDTMPVPREQLEQLLDRVAHREDPDKIANELCSILLGKEGEA